MNPRGHRISTAALLIAAALSLFAVGCGDRERPAPRVEVSTPASPRSGDVIVSYVLYDSESWPAKIAVQYSLDGGLTYADATKGAGGDDTEVLLTSQRGIAHSFVWDSVTDAGYVNEDNVIILIVATTRKTGLPSTTSNFLLQNFEMGTWEPNLRIDDGSGIAAADSPRLTAVGDSIFAVWADYRNGDSDVYFACSLDAGTTWSSSLRVNDDVGSSAQLEPAIASDNAGSTVCVVWTDFRDGDSSIYMATGSNPGSGFAFAANSRVSSASSISAVEPVVSLYETPTYTNLYVAWTDSRGGDKDIYFRFSDDVGGTWDDEVLVNDDGTSYDQYEPTMAPGDWGNVYLAWTDLRSANFDVYSAAGSNPGSGYVFGTNVRVDDDTGTASASEPSIAVYGSEVYVAYSDCRDIYSDIYVATSVDSAVSFATNLKASDDSGNAAQYGAALAVNDSTGELYLAFTDERSDGPSIYFTSSTSPGTVFDANVRIDDDPDNSSQSAPDIAYGSRVFVIFTDLRNTDSDIYFTRRPKN